MTMMKDAGLDSRFIELRDDTGSSAWIAPGLGGWLVRYRRALDAREPVDVLHFSQEVVDRYPREMYAGNPILFPMVSYNHLPGREHHYEVGGRVYSMGQHGFARRMPWSILSREPDRLTMELRDTPATLAQYPFAFQMRFEYRLAGGRLHGSQRVVNLSESVMPFSTGIHPYFAVPIRKGGDRSKCYAQVPAGTQLFTSDHGASFTSEPFPARRLPVAEDVAHSLFFADLAQRELAIVDEVAGLASVLNYEAAPRHRYAVLWARSVDAPFYCLEPWTALPNSFNRAGNGDLVALAPGEAMDAAFWMDQRSL